MADTPEYEKTKEFKEDEADARRQEKEIAGRDVIPAPGGDSDGGGIRTTDLPTSDKQVPKG